MDNFKNLKDLSKYDALRQDIIGFAVDFPKYFLSDEDLRLKGNQVEFYLPDIGFVWMVGHVLKQL